MGQRSQKPRKSAQTERHARKQFYGSLLDLFLVEKEQFAVAPQRLQFQQRHQLDLSCYLLQKRLPFGISAQIGQSCGVYLCPLQDAEQGELVRRRELPLFQQPLHVAQKRELRGLRRNRHAYHSRSSRRPWALR